MLRPLERLDYWAGAKSGASWERFPTFFRGIATGEVRKHPLTALWEAKDEYDGTP